VTFIDTGVPHPADPAPSPTEANHLRLVPRRLEAATAPAPPQRSAPQLRAAVEGAGWVRVGPVALGSLRRYLVTWAAVLFGVLLVLQLVAYVLLSMLGVTGSVSKALAVVLGEQLPASGVVPALQLHNVLPLALLVSLVGAALLLVTAAGVVLMHNAVTELTGGFQVRLRPDARGARPQPERAPGSLPARVPVDAAPRPT
jgi:hypothetical protein